MERFEAVFLLFMALSPCHAFGNITLLSRDKEELRAEFIADLIALNLKSNGWNNILCMGSLPNNFYSKIKQLHFTSVVTNTENEEQPMDGVVPYDSNIIIIHCKDLDDFDKALIKTMASPYWHAHSNIILYYNDASEEDIAKIFFIFWFYAACNAIIVQYDDFMNSLLISQYSPYISENFKLQKRFGCWKVTKIGRAIAAFRDSFKCEEGCVAPLTPARRSNYLGTCIGFDTHTIPYGDWESLQALNVFEDKSKDLHGHVLRAYVAEVLPFLRVIERPDGTYELGSRDGTIWNILSELMNFGIDMTPSRDIIKKPFEFEVHIQHIFKFSKKHVDLILFPVYLMDLIIVDVDMSIPYVESGVCVMSHRADFETIVFDTIVLMDNYMFLLEFALCIFIIWGMFFLYTVIEKRRYNFDEAGKALINTIRNILSISIPKQPSTRRSFRVFLSVTVWSFFAINFVTQAAIISFLTASKRGKEVDTFDDVIEKGYMIESMASPDMMLPETEERFGLINAKLIPTPDFFACVNRLSNDSHRFCLIDCSVGRYLEANKLDEKGEQYLHIAAKDRFHSHYLISIFHKHSPLTDTFNKYLRIFFESGLIQKWTENVFANIKEDAQINPLSMETLMGLFKCYCLFIGLSFSVFVLEVLLHVPGQAKRCVTLNMVKWKRIRAAKKKLKLEKKLDKVKHVSTSTQTV